MRPLMLGLAAVVLAAAPAAPRPAPGTAPPPATVIDDFENVSGWSAIPAEGVTASVARDAGEHGHALRLDVNFERGTGYAVVRRAVSLDLPPDYVFRVHVRGTVPTNHLEFKL